MSVHVTRSLGRGPISPIYHNTISFGAKSVQRYHIGEAAHCHCPIYWLLVCIDKSPDGYARNGPGCASETSSRHPIDLRVVIDLSYLRVLCAVARARSHAAVRASAGLSARPRPERNRKAVRLYRIRSEKGKAKPKGLIPLKSTFQIGRC